MLKAFALILFSFFSLQGDFNSEVERYLARNFTGYEKIEFEIFAVPKNAAEIIIREREIIERSGGMVYVPVVIVRNDGSDYQSIVTVKVKLFEKALTAVNSIDRNTELSTADFELRTTETSGIRGGLIKNYESLSNLRSTCFIKTGSLLLYEMVEKLPAVYSGDKVKAMLRSGSVIISTDAFAREDGSIGETIKIKTNDNKQFRAKIIDSKNVNIIE